MKFYKFSELSIEAAEKAQRDDRIFSSKNNVKKNNFLNDQNLYREDGRLACLTIDERARWFDQQ